MALNTFILFYHRYHHPTSELFHLAKLKLFPLNIKSPFSSSPSSWQPHFYFLSLWNFFFLGLFVFSMVTPVAYGGSQAKSLIGVVATSLTPQPQQHQIWVMSATYTTAHGNARSLTHWKRPRIEPSISWFLAAFVNHWATMRTPVFMNLTTWCSTYKWKLTVLVLF